MDRPRRLVLVRHAESARNEAKKGSTYFADDAARRMVQGVPDHKNPLTANGISQARQTGQVIRERYGTFDYVYHSGYERTIQTVEEILSAYTAEERRRMQVRSNLFIRERDPGHTYDMTEAEAEAEAAFPWLREYWQTFGGFFARPPGGESLADVVERVYIFLNTLFRDRAGQDVLVGMHGGTLRCFRYVLERWDYEQALKWPPGQSPANCGVTVYEYNETLRRLELKTYNDVYWNEEGGR